MCGISGLFATANCDAEAGRDFVNEIVASQHSRGPDHQAVELIPAGRSTVILGHNRLSIIDLSAAANQPMWDADRSHCVIFNGEIYNYLEIREDLVSLGHRFGTQSDTEVLLEAFKEWGTSAFERFNGMFAIALYRARDERLWLVRDRFGIKPLYYHLDDSTLIFASTGTVIARRLGLMPDLEYVARGIKMWVYEDDTQISHYRGLKSMLPAHFMEVIAPDPGNPLKARIEPYYNLADRVAELQEKLAVMPIPKLIDEVLERLESAVSLRLRSDVPIGISLSGGLDSTALSSIVSANHSEVVGFTYGSRNEQRSEGPLVGQVQDRLGIEVEYVQPEGSAMVSAFWDCLRSQDSPFAGCSIVAQYLVFKAARARGVKVLIGGQGGDELFMGYHKFQFFRLAELRRQGRLIDALIFALGLCPMVLSEARRASLYAQALRRYRGNKGLPVSLCLPEPTPCSMQYDSNLELVRRQMLDATRLSLPTLLRYEDRNSMGNSVESRLPFMDFRVAELGFALPTAVKLRNGYGKWILRQAMSGRLPESIRSARYKRGFSANEPAWIAAGLGTAIREALRANVRDLQDILPLELQIDTHFSDERLRAYGSTFSEATSLLWLAGRL